MIRQDKRKRRWLEKNGFTFVTEDNFSVFVDACREVDRGAPIKPLRYYAFRKYRYHQFDEIYIIDRTFIKRDLHEIKLDYISTTQGSKPISKFMSAWWSLHRFKRQCGALIKYGINPWW
ncbi:hypothetical protein ABIE27_004701 [Paenibacillus sp. 4624]|uniref:hypothetical protein n=1 Tax=Paenibacillus sp. 4624 TaxID=3156453 RepID=UPI003D1A0811